uniref:Integrase zinc-binding domain-containing protein n=1 Tax=Vitis vinifera TaxID=29760 RepID=A5C0A2_VITVI|nr:hypothetical protein VITISV_004478 [Vitis vinifera]
MGLLLQSTIGEQLEQAIWLGFPTSNNEAEYEAILVELSLALTLSASKLETCSDSQLVIRKIQGEYEAKDEHMARCLNDTEVQYVLAELHEGVCGNHVGGRTLAHRAHWQEYYWPTMKQDAANYVKRCDQCQRHAPIPHISHMPSKFLLMATDYFNKWVEAEAYANIKDKDVSRTLPFAIAYGMNAVIPMEVDMPTARTIVQGQRNDNLELERHLNWADKARGNAAIRMASYKQRAITHYNWKV